MTPILREIVEFPFPLDRTTAELVDSQISDLQKGGYSYESWGINEAMDRKYVTFVPPLTMLTTVSDGWVKAEIRDETKRLHRVRIAKTADSSPEIFTLINPPIGSPKAFGSLNLNMVSAAEHDVRVILQNVLSSNQIDTLLEIARANPANIGR